MRAKHRHNREHWKASRQPFMRDHRHRLVFIDETFINTKLYRLRGRAPLGERLHDTAPFGGWQTQTFIAGLRENAMIAPWVLDGPMNKTAFETYVETQLIPALNPGDVVILDNLSSHKSKRASELMKKAGCWFLFLPPYSPDLNPIELAFSKLKATSDASAQERSVTSTKQSHQSLNSTRITNAQTISRPQAMEAFETEVL